MPYTPVFEHAKDSWRPRWRGRVHAIAVALTIPAGVTLSALTPGGLPRVSVIIYVLSLVALFSTSASYHMFTHTIRTQRTMRQVDHAMVYVLIAGTYTPLCLLALPRDIGVPFLVLIWIAAAVGMGFKVAWKARRFTGALYLIIGWAAVAIMPWAYRNAGGTSILLFAIGGVLYTVGAILFYLQRPRLVPHVFGYHELWHVFTAAAAAVQFAGVGVLIARVT
ncbi:MAG: hemolysin III family protein [Ilumatobacteraceae bacterium]